MLRRVIQHFRDGGICPLLVSRLVRVGYITQLHFTENVIAKKE